MSRSHVVLSLFIVTSLVMALVLLPVPVFGHPKPTKEATPIVCSGETIDYTVTLNNVEPFDGVVVTDTLPGDVSYVVSSGSPAPDSVVGNVITWNLGSVPVGVIVITFQGLTASGLSDGTVLINQMEVDSTGWPTNFAQASTTITDEGCLQGRMTGGGSVINAGMRTTHGFELHCDVAILPNNLEVNWGKGPNKDAESFHLTLLVTANCSDDPALDPVPPPAPFDTYEGFGIGRYNGVDGAVAQWVFTDDGEPGGFDHMEITIWSDAGMGTQVHFASGNIQQGNHQAHTQN